MALAQTSCRLASDVIAEDRENRGEATYDAMQRPAATITPDENVVCDIWGCRTATPAPPTEVPTPGPTATSYLVQRTVLVEPATGDWAPYFASEDDAGTYQPGSYPDPLGVIGRGLSLSVIEEIHAGLFLKVLLVGTMELRDLGLDEEALPEDVYRLSGTTRCVNHTWGHVSPTEVCHGHFWNHIVNSATGYDAWEVIATIPGDDPSGYQTEGLTYIVLSHGVDDKAAQGRVVERVQVIILEPVWIRCQDTASGCPSGVP